MKTATAGKGPDKRNLGTPKYVPPKRDPKAPKYVPPKRDPKAKHYTPPGDGHIARPKPVQMRKPIEFCEHIMMIAELLSVNAKRKMDWCRHGEGEVLACRPPGARYLVVMDRGGPVSVDTRWQSRHKSYPWVRAVFVIAGMLADTPEDKHYWASDPKGQLFRAEPPPERYLIIRTKDGTVTIDTKRRWQ